MTPRRPSPPASVFALRRALVGSRSIPRIVAGILSDGARSPATSVTALAWLACRDTDAVIRSRAARVLERLAPARRLGDEERRACLKAGRGALLAALADPGLPDGRKLELIPALEAFGAPLHPQEVGRSFRDPDRAHRHLVGRQLAALPATPAAIDRELRLAGTAGTWPGTLRGEEDLDALFTVGEIAAESHPALAAILLPALAAAAARAGLGVRQAAQQLETAAATRHPFALFCLRELASLPGVGAIGESARLGAEELQRTGVAVAAPPSPAFTRGWASVVDGAGSRQLALLFRSGRGRAALFLLLNDREGLKDIFFAPEGGTEMARGLAHTPGIVVAPSDLPFARSLLADAIARHHEAGVPLPAPFLLFRAYLGDEPIAPRRRAPDLSAYALDRWPRTRALVERSELLASLPLCEELYCASDEAYAFLAARMRRDGASRVTFDIDERAYRAFLRDVAGAERELLARRLAVNLEVEARSGRAGRPENRALARVLIALVEEVVPFEEVPFVQALNGIGMRRVAQNVALGHSNQREANDAAERD